MTNPGDPQDPRENDQVRDLVEQERQRLAEESRRQPPAAQDAQGATAVSPQHDVDNSAEPTQVVSRDQLSGDQLQRQQEPAADDRLTKQPAGQQQWSAHGQYTQPADEAERLGGEQRPAERPAGDQRPAGQERAAESAATTAWSRDEQGDGSHSFYQPPNSSSQSPDYGAAPATRFYDDQRWDAQNRETYPGGERRRVEVAPAPNRFLPNFLGALVGLALIIGAAYLWSMQRDFTPDNLEALRNPSTGRLLGWIGVGLLVGVVAFLAFWAPATAWFPGAILTVLLLVQVFSSDAREKLVELAGKAGLSQTGAAEFFGTVWIGPILLLGGIGASIGRRAATNAALDRIVAH